ncbi:ankyrin-3-like [Asterias amurensis]|uniref:ankyrin-3-like n=1 Tax=Asterias amurensis TaxID=7602 RepID=UPI003AB415D7
MAASTAMDPDQTASVLSDKYFRNLSSRLGREWEALATHLDFRKSEIDRIKMNNQLNVDNQIFDMLVQWRQRLGKLQNCHEEKLSQSLKSVERNDLAVQLEEIICEVDSSSGSTDGNTTTNQQQKPVDEGPPMSYTYEDSKCKINIKNLKIAGKDNAIFYGPVSGATINFN